MYPEEQDLSGLQEMHEGAESVIVAEVPAQERPVYPVAEAAEQACSAFEVHQKRGGLTLTLDRAHLAKRLAPVVSLEDALKKLQEEGGLLEGSEEGPGSTKEQEYLRFLEVKRVPPEEESRAVLAGYTLVGPNGDRYAVR